MQIKDCDMKHQKVECLAMKRSLTPIRRWSIMSVVALSLLGASITVAQTPPPIIFFTDLTSGPNSGGESVSGFSGAYVTIYGNFFGPSQGSSTVTLNGANCLRVVSWGSTWL